MAHLKVYNSDDIEIYFTSRPNEKKWGEEILLITDEKKWDEELKKSSADFVLLGVPEDIGIRANYGKGGADETWIIALNAILSLQQNKFTNAKSVLLLGHLDCSEEQSISKNYSVEDLRKTCSKIDEALIPIIRKISSAGKKIILIGGGHNNSYPLIRGVSEAMQSPINCINIDPHSDYRIIEGRHSGNGFRYAKEEGYLKKYSVFGLHENYSPDSVTNDLENNRDLNFISFEEMLIRKRITPEVALGHLINDLIPDPCGLEIDLDSVQFTPVSAISPVGWNPNEIRTFVHQCSSLLPTKYLHLAEGSAGLASTNEKNMLGKMIAYLVSDYIRSA